MQLTIWLSFVSASLIFGLVPGPSVCFTIAYALRYGTRRTSYTILGQLSANCCQIVVVLFGMSHVIERSAFFFHGLKIIGALYLAYVGYRLWTAEKPQLNVRPQGGSGNARTAFADGFVVCGTNPKAILYYAALLPQFVVPYCDKNLQLATLAATSVIIAAMVLVFYTVLADRMRYLLQTEKYLRVQNRLTALLMMTAGIALFAISR